MPPAKTTTLRFLEWVFGDALDANHLVVIWLLPSKRSKFFDNVEAAARYAIEEADSSDVYFGVGLLRQAPKRGRGKLTDVAGIGGMWADIDVAGPGHLRTDLPPSFDDARSMIDDVGPRPSVIVDSGHGMHVYWLFPEPWLFDDDKERKDAGQFSAHWWATVAAVAARRGWRVDPAHDLTRVLRLPGTFNRKSKDDIREVALIEPRRGEPGRWSWLDLDPYLIAQEFAPGAVTDRPYDPVDAIVLRPDAGPPNEKIERLCEVDRKFKLTWAHRRTDLKDSTASSYDMALADILVIAGWSDQEIADAIIAWRRKHMEKPKKALRRDYIMRTLAKARHGMASEAALAQLALEGPPRPERPADAPAGAPAVISDEKRRAWLQLASEAVGVKITRVIKQGAENSTYAFVLGDQREVVVGPIANLLNPNRVRERVADIAGTVMGRVTMPRWDSISSGLLAVAIVVENLESSTKQRVHDWVHRYLTEQSSQIFPEPDWKKALIHNDPFFRDKMIFVHAPSVARFIRMADAAKVEDRDMWTGLRQLGFKNLRVSARLATGEDPTTRSYWAGAPEIVSVAVAGDQLEFDKPAPEEPPI